MPDFEKFDFSCESFTLDDLKVFCLETGYEPSEILLYSIDKKLERIGMLNNLMATCLDAVYGV